MVILQGSSCDSKVAPMKKNKVFQVTMIRAFKKKGNKFKISLCTSMRESRILALRNCNCLSRATLRIAVHTKCCRITRQLLKLSTRLIPTLRVLFSNIPFLTLLLASSTGYLLSQEETSTSWVE